MSLIYTFTYNFKFVIRSVRDGGVVVAFKELVTALLLLLKDILLL